MNNTIAKVYWRSIKRVTRTLQEVPGELRQIVKVMAQQDVAAGKISPEVYQVCVGEPYAAETGNMEG